MAPLIPDEVLNFHRRRLLGAAAMSIAAARLGAIGPANAQTAETKQAATTPRTTASLAL
jgi:hypothetical protein